jgi:hypothetical protein
MNGQYEYVNRLDGIEARFETIMARRGQRSKSIREDEALRIGYETAAAQASAAHEVMDQYNTLDKFDCWVHDKW